MIVIVEVKRRIFKEREGNSTYKKEGKQDLKTREVREKKI